MEKNFMKEYVEHMKKFEEDCIKRGGEPAFLKDKFFTDKFDEYRSQYENEIDRLEKEIKRIHTELESKRDVLNNVYSNIYNNNVDTFDKDIVIRYDSSRGNTPTTYFSLNSGEMVSEDEVENAYIVNIGKKSDDIYVPYGYVYERGGILLKGYRVSVNATNTKINCKLTNEVFINVLGCRTDTKIYSGENCSYNATDYLRDINAEKFISNMFGREGVDVLTLSNLYYLYTNNVNAETIVKCAPLNSIKLLLEMRVKEQMPIYQMLGISKECYNKAVEDDVVDIVIALSQYIKQKDVFNLTDFEWLDLIKKNKEWESDLRFYNISMGYYSYRKSCALEALAEQYFGHNEFKNNYSFRRFCNYVVNATIDQGYNSVYSYTVDLRDYISMSQYNNSIPTLETDYLKMTHDIAKRNFDIRVSEDEEKTFAEKYENFKNYKKSVYSVIAPKTTNDIKDEGNQLNHCIASYIHRIIKGECLIVFLRKSDALEKSLVTVEIKNNTVCQYKGRNNRGVNDDEMQMLKEFAKDNDLEFV